MHSVRAATLVLMAAALVIAAHAAAMGRLHSSSASMFEGRGRKIEFDHSVGMASHNVVYEEEEEEGEEEDYNDEEFSINTQGYAEDLEELADLEHLKWIGVNRDGYEFEGTLTEVEEMLTMDYSDEEEEKAEDELEEESFFYGNEADGHSSDTEYHNRTASMERIDPGLYGADATAGKCKKIYGGESRKRANVNSYPYKAIGKVLSGCTGAFIGPRHVLTAGHCVYNRDAKKWYSNLDFLQAKDCNPDTGIKRYNWVRALSVTGFTSKGQAHSDYGLIIVRESSPTWLGFGWRTFLLGWTINTAGYPYDKTPYGCMWWQSCHVRFGTTTTTLRFRCDVASGQSGSPIWVYRKGKRTVYGVVTHCSSPSNRGVRINKDRFNRIKKWIADN